MACIRAPPPGREAGLGVWQSRELATKARHAAWAAVDAAAGLSDPRRVTVAAEEPTHVPRARPRCRNRPLAAWRRARAVELATLGLTYDVIAREVGYTNRGTAYRVVREALARRTAEAVDA